MKLRRVLKGLFLLFTILCGVVAGIMYNKLSFIDWPYIIGGFVFLILALAIPLKKNV